MVDEITLGPLTFQLERTHGAKRAAGISVVNGEETIGYCEPVSAEEWEEFHAAAAMGATVVQALRPAPKDSGLGPVEAREKAALARHEQTLQMLGALQFQMTVLTMSLGALLGRPDHHDVIRKDVADLEAQATELGRFMRRLLYLRASEG